MKANLATFVALFMPFLAAAQDTAKQLPQPKEPQTKLEQFQAKTGTVIIMGFSTVGTVQALFGSTITVETREFTDASNGNKQFGITIEVKESGRENKSFIDLDEIDSLLKGIDYIAAVNNTVTKLSKFQADYRTRGDFAVSIFSTSKGDIGAAVKTGRFGGASAFLDVKELPKLRQLIATAQTTLQSIKSP
jgi:hypothetical protein